jgi:hypothetical protein
MPLCIRVGAPPAAACRERKPSRPCAQAIAPLRASHRAPARKPSRPCAQAIAPLRPSHALHRPRQLDARAHAQLAVDAAQMRVDRAPRRAAAATFVEDAADHAG